jgi:hypothetical protein
MKRTIAYAALTTIVAALVASTLVSDERERRQPGERRGERYSKVGNAGDESAEAQVKAEQFAQARMAPGIVLPGAYSAAFAQLIGLPVSGASWTEVTNRPYNADDPRYRGVRARHFHQLRPHLASADAPAGAAEPLYLRAGDRSGRSQWRHGVRRLQWIFAGLDGRPGRWHRPSLEDDRRRREVDERKRQSPRRPG